MSFKESKNKKISFLDKKKKKLALELCGNVAKVNEYLIK